MTRLLTFGFLLATSLRAQGPATDWRFAHPDAAIRASINVQTLLKSPVIASIKDQVPKEQQAQVAMGLALLSSIDRVSLSMAAPAVKPADGKPFDPDVLAVVSGGFDAGFLQSMLAGSGSAGTTQVKQVDAHTVLVGSNTSFAASLRRLSGGLKSSGADELESNDVWLWADLNQLNKLPDTNLQMEGLKSFSFGVNLGENVDLNLIATAADAAGAQKLLETFNFLMKQSGMPADSAAMLAKALDMRVDGTKLRVHFAPPPEMIKAAQQQASGGAGGGLSPASLQPLLGMLGLGGGNAAGGGPAAAPQKANEPPPSNGGKIMIYGLDDGPKEVKPGK
ncbi:MAG TPA: hypothetical protein VGN17_23115 [Bryobacteraceae bacterium]|jgi:hypothetical protein